MTLGFTEIVTLGIFHVRKKKGLQQLRLHNALINWMKPISSYYKCGEGKEHKVGMEILSTDRGVSRPIT